jgi:cation transporter-like permease
MSIIDQAKPYESLALWGAQTVLNCRMAEEPLLRKVVRITLSEVAFVGIAIVGVFETAIKAALFAAIKLCSFLHPDKEAFRDYIVLDALKQLTFSAVGTAQATTALVYNFLPDEIADPIYTSMINSVGNATICCTGEFDDRTANGTPLSWF